MNRDSVARGVRRSVANQDLHVPVVALTFDEAEHFGSTGEGQPGSGASAQTRGQRIDLPRSRTVREQIEPSLHSLELTRPQVVGKPLNGCRGPEDLAPGHEAQLPIGNGTQLAEDLVVAPSSVHVSQPV
jgi:hypothetical protein